MCAFQLPAVFEVWPRDMTRKVVRDLKRTARAGTRPGADAADRMLSRECAVELLSRSIRFAHGKLAVLRLVMAVECGASIAPEHWRYCKHVAESSEDIQVKLLYQSAAMQAADW